MTLYADVLRDGALCRCAAPVSALYLMLAGCATLDAVREFVTTAYDATVQFSPFVRDIADSCVRRKLAERPAVEIEGASGPATAACKEDFDLTPDVLGSMNVLSNYFNALVSTLHASAKLPAPATDAVKGLAKILAERIASRYQRQKLAEALTAADPHVTVLTNALGRIVGIEYFRDLENEEDTVKNRYTDAMRSVQQNDAVALLLQRQWRRDLETLQKKKAAARGYQKALEEVRDGHKQLATRATRLSGTELAKELGPYTASIRRLDNSVEAAFFWGNCDARANS